MINAITLGFATLLSWIFLILGACFAIFTLVNAFREIWGGRRSGMVFAATEPKERAPDSPTGGARHDH